MADSASIRASESRKPITTGSCWPSLTRCGWRMRRSATGSGSYWPRDAHSEAESLSSALNYSGKRRCPSSNRTGCSMCGWPRISTGRRLRASTRNAGTHNARPAPGHFPDPAFESSPAGNVRLGILKKANTLVLCDPDKIVGHPAMRAIIALGEDVVPLMLRDLWEKPSLSVWASTFRPSSPDREPRLNTKPRTRICHEQRRQPCRSLRSSMRFGAFAQ